MHPNFAGALINSALYLLMVFVAGIVTAHPLAWKLAIAAAGFAYLSHLAYLTNSKRAGDFIVVISLVVGFGSGLELLF